MLLSPYELGRIEAALDGEGCIGLHKEKIKGSKYRNHVRYREHVSISNTSPDFIRKARQIIGSATTWRATRQRGGRYEREKPIYRLLLSAGTIRWLFPQLSLSVKDRQRHLLLEVMQIKDSREKRGRFAPYTKDERYRFELIRRQLRRLNRRGVWEVGRKKKRMVRA